MEEKIPPQIPQEPPVLTKSQKRKKILLLLAGLIGFNLFVFGAFYYSISDKGQKSDSLELSLKRAPNAQVTPTPFPFQEMTIPYLRARSYESSLGPLVQVSSNSEYMSYLTSYDSEGFKA